jgi:cytochrome c oxidase subunit 2
VRMPLFRGTKKRWLLLVTGMLLSSILLAACGENSPSILNTAGPVAASESFVFWVILIIATVVFVGVEAMLIYSAWRYRERPNSPTPRQSHGNVRVELIWTVIPAVILFVVLIFTIRGLIEVAPENQPSGPTEVVRAVGHQWWWEFYYPKYNITTADSLHVPVGSVIQVELYSNNVIHSFWVPALTGKTDVVPGHDNQKWFVADKPGVYEGICAEFCGLQHANMRFNVVAQDSASFNTWVISQQQAAAQPAAGSLAAAGQQIFKNQCSTCHGIIGTDTNGYIDPKAQCNNPASPVGAPCFVGPNLTHFGSRTSANGQGGLIAGGVLENNLQDCQPGDPNLLEKCNLAKWLNDPQGIKPGNDMNIGSLSKDSINKLVAYLESLK